jgi:hypothetical protein
MSYADLATKYDLSESDCIKRYSYATKRLLEVLKIMDSKIEKDKNNKYLKQVQERSGSLPRGQRWYLLNKLFGLLPSEIAELVALGSGRPIFLIFKEKRFNYECFQGLYLPF